MAIINFTHKFLFVHIPKAAGTTVTRTLAKLTALGDVEVGGTEFGEIVARAYGPRFGVRKHSTGAELRKATGESTWGDLFKFSFVRHPYARAFSTFTFLKHRYRDWPGSEVMDGFESFDSFVASEFFASEGPDRLFRPQLFWLRTSPEDDSIVVDFVGRVESIGADLGRVLTRISPDLAAPEPESVPRMNESAEPDAWRAAYASAQTRERVAQRYRNDFAKFGYSADMAGAASE